MDHVVTSGAGTQALEQALREELVRGDAMLGATRPLLRHLLVNEDPTLISEEMVARVRGMILDIARQLVIARSEGGGQHHVGGSDWQERLATALFHDTALLEHAHAVALEGQLAERLHARCGFDPVLPPLIQDLAAGDPEGAELSMVVLAAQARFMQQYRRMELPLAELPADLLHKVLLVLRAHGEEDSPAHAAEQALRARYDEAASRLALLSRLVVGPGASAPALTLVHAGLAIFTTALAAATGQPRELIVLSFADRQFGRLALALRAAALGQQDIAEVFMVLHPEIALPAGLGGLSPARALELLAGSGPEPALQES